MPLMKTLDKAILVGARRKTLRKKLKISTLINWTVNCILAIGFLWQIISLLNLYLSYPTNIFIETKFNSYRKSLPALTFCTNIGDQIGTTDDIFLANNISDYILEIFILNHDNSMIFLTENFTETFIESVGKRFYCLTFNSLIKGEFQISFSKNSPCSISAKSQFQLSHNERLVFVFGHSGIKNKWFLTMHSSFNYPSSYGWDGIDVEENYFYILSYAVQTYHLLESPHSTNCLNYKEKTVFLSREDCVRKCRIRESQSKCGVVSHEIDVFRGEPNLRLSETIVEEKCIERLDLKKLCYEMCPNDNCLIPYYKPIVVTQGTQELGGLSVNIIIPSEPETSYHHKPSVEIIEFLCYLASTVSLWFGFSLFSIISYVKSIELNVIFTKIIQKL